MGKTVRGVGVRAGDCWEKVGDWELGDPVTELRCFGWKVLINLPLVNAFRFIDHHQAC